eukprot:TRINITY_DN3779_c0_g1_i1.p1 TRINITY_DN3779_c0_g1~~TRINITY_DN3779_c0_g1_i1.p1  ORF type:complete len:1317 (+),score=180.34 TRINITY_DN3779_c0_g1_i1:393-3953(+)
MDLTNTDIYHALVKRIQMQLNQNRKVAKLKPKLTTVPLLPPDRNETRSTSLFANPDAWSNYVLNREAGITGKSRNTALDMTVLLAEQAVREREQQKHISKQMTKTSNPQRFQQQATRKTVVEASVEDGPGMGTDLKLLKQQLEIEEQLSRGGKPKVTPPPSNEEEAKQRRLRKAEEHAQAIQKDFDVYAVAEDGEYRSPQKKAEPPTERPSSGRDEESGRQKDSFTRRLEQAEKERMSADEKRAVVGGAQSEHGQLKHAQAGLKRQQQEEEDRRKKIIEQKIKEEEERLEREKEAEKARLQQVEAPPDIQAPPPIAEDTQAVSAAPPPVENVATSSAAPPATNEDQSSDTAEELDKGKQPSPDESGVIVVQPEVMIHTALVNARGLTLRDSDNREEAEQFIQLFEQAGVHYTEKNYEEAYETWAAALEKAKKCNQKEWIAVVQGNLNNLSYQLLTSQGKEHGGNQNYAESVHCYKLAIEIATNASKPAWKVGAENALVDIQLDQVQSLHTAAVKIFDELIDIEHQAQLNKPKSPADYIYPPPRTEQAFQQEWARLLKVKEAVELWTEAMKLNSIVYSQEAAVPMQETLDNSINVLLQYQYKLVTVPSVFQYPTQAPCGAMNYTTRQREQLLQCWLDIDMNTPTLGSRSWEAALQLILAAYHFSLFHNDAALQCVITFIDIVNSLPNLEMLALGYTFLGNIHLQNKRWGEAEHALCAAIPLWTDLRTPWGEEPKTMALRGFILEQLSLTYQYLTQAHIGRQMYLEALRASEMAKIYAYGDYLQDKLQVNYELNLTPDRMMAIASQHHTTIVCFTLAYEYDWDMENSEMNRLESLYTWVLPPQGEVKFVETPITGDYGVDSLHTVLSEAYEALNVTKDDDATGDEVVTQSHELLPNWREPLQQLFDFLFYPVTDFVTAAAGGDINFKITFVPDKFLWAVPFGLLMDNTGEHLIQQYAISQAFCIVQMAFNTLQNSRQAEWLETLESTHNQLYHVFADMAPLQNAALPIEMESRADTLAVSGAMHTRPYINTECTVHTIVKTLSFARIVHFGGPLISVTKHKGIWGCLPVTPDDLCPSGLLHAADMQKMDCKCEVVSFSNATMCREAVYMGGDGIIGMLRATMCAGVPTVVATLWAKAGSAAILGPFYQTLYEKRGIDPAVALAHAVRKVQKLEPLSPRLWGRFLHIGV